MGSTTSNCTYTALARRAWRDVLACINEHDNDSARAPDEVRGERRREVIASADKVRARYQRSDRAQLDTRNDPISAAASMLLMPRLIGSTDRVG